MFDDSIQHATCRSLQINISCPQVNTDSLDCQPNDSRQAVETSNNRQHFLKRMLCLQVQFWVLISQQRYKAAKHLDNTLAVAYCSVLQHQMTRGYISVQFNIKRSYKFFFILTNFNTTCVLSAFNKRYAGDTDELSLQLESLWFLLMTICFSQAFGLRHSKSNLSKSACFEGEGNVGP